MSMLEEFESTPSKEVARSSANMLQDFDSIKPPARARPTETGTSLRSISATLAAPQEALAETAAHVVSGIGSSIIGGWRGLAELARGGRLEDAVQAVQGQDDNALAGQYQPESKGGQVGAEIMSSKYNPLNWPGAAFKHTGEFYQDKGVGPGVATAIETLGNAAMLGVPALSKAPVKPNIKGPMGVLAEKPRLKGPPAVLEEAKALEFKEPESFEGKTVPKQEQARRAAVLRRVGVTEARKSAIEGDVKSAATDHQVSKLDNPSGRFMQSAMDNEKSALAKHTEEIISDTGGTLGMDESARMARGNTILAPLDSLKGWFDSNVSKLYKDANEKAGGVPVDLPDVHNFVKDHRADFLGTTEGKALLEGVNERMKSLGMVDAEGNPAAVTVEQAEKLHQYLGRVWTPRTGYLIRELKDNILEGVTRNAGEDVYKQARSLRAMRAVTLDDPKGISKVMDASGPEGINRSVPIEKIPDAISGMPVEQLEHVIKTLKNVPKELQPQAEAAIGEIRAHIANKVLDTGLKHEGQWNAKGVSKVLKENSQRMGIVFTPEQIAKFGDLNEAGHILAKDQSYPGAAVQEHNLVQRGAMGAIRSGSAATGAAIAGPFGAAVGDFLGSGLAKKFGEGASLRATQKRVVKLSDFPK